MRHPAALPVAVVVASLLLPSGALAADDHGDPDPAVLEDHEEVGGRWIGEQEHFAVVLPNGETFTEGEEPEEPPESDVAPVGTRLFVSEVLYATEGDNTRGEQLGRAHVECTAQVVPQTFRCQVAWVFDDTGSQLHGSATVDFSTQSETEPLHFPIAVTGGTGEYLGASGEVWLLDVTEEAETLTLYEAGLVLHEEGDS